MSKPTVWRWQGRCLDEAVAKSQAGQDAALPHAAPAAGDREDRQDAPPNATHGSRVTMAEAVRISPSGVGRIRAGEADQHSIR